MLRHLRVTNFAILSDVTLELGPIWAQTAGANAPAALGNIRRPIADLRESADRLLLPLRLLPVRQRS